MLKTYMKIILRNVLRNRLYAVINVAGLAIGIACAFLIFRWVQHEKSYDTFLKDADATYRVNWSFKWNGNEGVGSTTPVPLAAKLIAEVPGITSATRVYPVPPMVARSGDRFFNEPKIIGVDSNFIDFFGFPLLSGDPKKALSVPNRVVMTRSAARKYFGDESPVGKTIALGEKTWEIHAFYDNIFTVTGVVEDPPENSHLQFSMLTSISSYPSISFFNWSWLWMHVVTYARTNERSSIPLIETNVRKIVARDAPSAFRRVGFSYDELIQGGGRWDFVFQPLTDVYLGSSQIGNMLGPIGNRSFVYAFSLIAIFLLLIACVNFMNLSTARVEKRAREVGVRKTLGSTRESLFAQFAMESIVFSLLALPVALILIEFLESPFETLVGKTLPLDLLNPIWQLPALILLALCVGMIAGSYPGVYLSSFRPVQILKGLSRSRAGGSRLRGILTISQFAVSIGLIVCTLLVQRQMTFVRNADLGFSKEDLVVISNINNPLGNQLDAFKEHIKTFSSVIDASVTTGAPPSQGFWDYYKVPGKGDEQLLLASYTTDEDFIATLGIRLKAGRGFQKATATDSASVILNETAVKQFGIQDPIGKTINYPSKGNYTIIGVMQDFNFMDLHSPLMPFALFEKSSRSYQLSDSYIIVRLKRDALAAGIHDLQASWDAFTSKTPFDFSFLDQSVARQYTSERNLGNIFLAFSILAIFIASLGLLGLTAFVTEQRTKEIGVRKVLGASVLKVVLLLSKEVTKWILLANLVAWPLAYVLMTRWLEDFAYRTPIDIWIFVLSGAAAFIIAMVTVCGHAIKAATANPVESLRYE